MTVKHLQDLLISYAQDLIRRGYYSSRKDDAIEFPEPILKDADKRMPLEHALWMCEESLGFIRDGDHEKAMRWLCFIQGTLWFCRVYTIEQMREHSRPPERGGKLPVEL